MPSKATSAVRHFSAIVTTGSNQRFVDRGRLFGLNGPGHRWLSALRHKSAEAGCDMAIARIALHPGRGIDAGLRSATGERHRAWLRLRPDRARLRARLQGN